MKTEQNIANAVSHRSSLDEPTVLVLRGNWVESRHHIAYAVASADGKILASAGDIDEPVFMRSSAKPLICAAIIATGVAEKFNFTHQEIAIIAGSHSGEPHHVETVIRILEKIGLDEKALQCGPHPPFHEASAQALTARGEQPRAVHNNCSGKHAGMLALAVYRGLSAANYLELDHPAQVEIATACAGMLGVSLKDIPVGTDGCGTPVIAVPLRIGAGFYARLSDKHHGGRWDGALARVCAAMIAHPDYVGGTGRFDTDLMMAAVPNLLCKSGAEGYHATCIRDRGIGMVIKVLDGNDRAVSPFVVNSLLARRALSEKQASLVEQHRSPPIVNYSRQVVGKIRYLDGS